MRKNRKWMKQAVRSLLVLMLTFVLAVPVMAEAKAVDYCAEDMNTYSVAVASGYLALRNAQAYNDANEIGKLYSGDTVDVMNASDSTYWYVYSPKLDKSGYVDKNYIKAVESESTSNDSWTVKVKSGYLALRTEKAFKSSNEIGKLYTGDTVQIADSSDSSYWLVYAPGLGKGGYVNKDYLVDAVSVIRKTVKVTSGYLALRSEMAYDDENEIGRLNTGDIVQIADSSDSTYWRVYSERLGKFGYVNKNYLQ